MTPVVRLEGIHKRYPQGPHVLRGVNLELRPGEFTAVTGPSGSGKTTLLNLLGLLDSPDEGTLLFEEREVLSNDKALRAELRKKRIGFVFQQPLLFPKRSVLENVVFRARYLPGPRRDWERAAAERLTQLGLAELAGRPAATLSGGEAQRVSIARALLVPPALLLADEPTGNLDHENALRVLDALTRAAADGISVLLVTHNLSLLQNVHRQLRCEGGRLMDA